MKKISRFPCLCAGEAGALAQQLPEALWHPPSALFLLVAPVLAALTAAGKFVSRLAIDHVADLSWLMAVDEVIRGNPLIF
jgi:hypothetical protein